ncbi:hypothetical protein D3C72_2473070 [compost metagenome]
MPARVRREMMAICGRASTATGKIRFASAPPFQPPEGKSCNLEPNISTSSGAVTKVGMQTPTMATAITP